MYLVYSTCRLRHNIYRACTQFPKWCGMSPNTSCSVYRAYIGVISWRLVSNGVMQMFRYAYGITLGATVGPTTEIRRQNTAAQAVVHHGWIWGLYWNPGRFDQFWTQMARKAEPIDIPETARTSIIRHSFMPMIPSESSICHANLGTTICFVPWSGYWLMPVIMMIMRRSGPGLIRTPCIRSRCLYSLPLLLQF